jgi:uracil-DNA glycosylase
MHFITLDCATDFDGWRNAARTLVRNEVKPSDVTWTVRGHEPELLETPAADQALQTPKGSFNVSAKFVELAQSAILHRDPARFGILYRLLWRLRSRHDLLNAATDPDLAQITAMAKAVHRDQHRMQALVRFREIGREQNSYFVAWFEPEHHIVEATARSLPAVSPTCPGRSSRQMSARIGTAMPYRSRQASARPRRRVKTGSRNFGEATTRASSIRPG